MELVGFFLRHPCPATLASFDYIAQTPLIRAAEQGHLEIVLALIAAGADVNAHDGDRIGNTAIREAVRGGHVDVVLALLAAGCRSDDPGRMQISAVDQAHLEIKGGIASAAARAIRTLLSRYPSRLRAQFKQRHKGDV